MIFENSQLFFIILLLLWILFLTEYMDNRRTSNNKMFALAQFGFMFPFVIILSDVCFNYPFGFIMVFLIPIISIWVMVDSFYYNKKR